MSFRKNSWHVPASPYASVLATRCVVGAPGKFERRAISAIRGIQASGELSADEERSYVLNLMALLIEVILDTGFKGLLTLPPAMIASPP